MDRPDIIYAAFADEMTKIAAGMNKLKALGLVGLGVGGTAGASALSQRWEAGSKELEERKIEDMQKRIARMQALHASKYDM